ncbi:hypothetical protein P171DRAFT_430115 [Karstenula rhodostoma CBS 690.94]|uniref:Uncharacterized protein n=1 Tax=Karstenula rhodostoma CBS 690.94 TaxID=1392251 RepID=A0A9P4PLB8_9PLEO|nr:hypothetical protein P171DRAFT_430115 [Karstenula rhodostoma CBS 690.94]
MVAIKTALAIGGSSRKRPVAQDDLGWKDSSVVPETRAGILWSTHISCRENHTRSLSTNPIQAQ